MITGFDHVEIIAGPPLGIISGFLDRVHQRWKKMLLSTVPGDFVPASEALANLPEGEGNLLVARDNAMIKRWDKDGYHLRGGEGPFSVIYHSIVAKSVRITLLNDPFVRSGYRYRPYEATLVGQGISMVTLVLPDKDSSFSKNLIQDFESVASGSR